MKDFVTAEQIANQKPKWSRAAIAFWFLVA